MAKEYADHRGLQIVSVPSSKKCLLNNLFEMSVDNFQTVQCLVPDWRISRKVQRREWYYNQFVYYIQS